ncbi:VWA domain-containing protein [Pseudenhygromyxa sp. WMMC2535]|uniref:VWA domain-containing protein n=1 Tax=Pseudenhygromyxa sp. WMMC2535 TaxID=2712867 RepID=UPI00155304C5|nr:VWA domain-containing protein [Pseudenhygromyxa sp. WMMC2535]NVB36249.1 VWA domain-containing protein [Pseudenhygromyxa sp. WMMC2535]
MSALRPLSLLASVALALPLTACGLQLTRIETAYEKPSNVAVYFKVENGKGEPVGGMTAEQFEIYEDGELVSTLESQQTILNPEVTASHYTLLLIDMSGSVVDSEDAAKVSEAALLFTSEVEKNNKVAIYAFDGEEDIHKITDFTTSSGAAEARANSLSNFTPKDKSTNLNGAVIQGLEVLDEGLAKAENPLRIGTLVVFTDGTDRASRVSEEEMLGSVRDSSYDVFAIGLGDELSESDLENIGKSGTALAKDSAEIQAAFETIGKRIDQLTRSYYLLSYCSPARAGEHTVAIKANHTPEGKKNAQTGELETEFDAEGFTKGCDPNKKPKFDITQGDALSGGEDKKPKKVKTKVKAEASASAS